MAKRNEHINEGLRHMPRTRAGFTLLELLVVIVIIGLLAGYVAPRYFAQEGKSKIQVTRAQIDPSRRRSDQYRLDTGHYPPPSRVWSRVTRPNNEPKWTEAVPAQGGPPGPVGPSVYL